VGSGGLCREEIVVPSTPQPPSLARVLFTALLFRQPSLDAAGLPDTFFSATVARCDEADRAYQAAIEGALAPVDAREVLATASAFRARVRDVRSAAHTECATLFARYGSSPVDFDPLDVIAPRIAGLSHADAVRLADLCDRAGRQVGELRAQANARIAPLLSDAARDELVTAKRARVAAFHGAVHAELAPLARSIERFSPTVESLATLADGWY
jgi:hypothetical protein